MSRLSMKIYPNPVLSYSILYSVKDVIQFDIMMSIRESAVRNNREAGQGNTPEDIRGQINWLQSYATCQHMRVA